MEKEWKKPITWASFFEAVRKSEDEKNRDLFAGIALLGIFLTAEREPGGFKEAYKSGMAEAAYKMADAMLEARAA